MTGTCKPNCFWMPAAMSLAVARPERSAASRCSAALRVISSTDVGKKIFDTLYVMTGGGPGVATETISVYIYKITTQDLTWAYVAAIALFILITLSVVANMALRRMGRRS